MTQILVAIPSKGRAVEIQRMLGRWLKPCLGMEIVVFAEPNEVKAYQETCREFAEVVNIGSTDQGLGYSKEVIKQYAQKHGRKYILKLDDDVIGFYGKNKRSVPPEMSLEIFKEAMRDALEAFETWPAVKGISYLYQNQMWVLGKWVAANRRFQTMYMAETQFFHADREISFNEDFIAGIDIISKGFKTICYGNLGIRMGYKVGHGKAGHNSFQRGRLADEEILRIRSRYPWLNVKKVEGKPWTMEFDFHNKALGAKTFVRAPKSNSPAFAGSRFLTGA